MLQACPPGEQNTALFCGTFIKRLLADLQVHLTSCETSDLKQLAQRADKLWTSHRRPAPLAALEQQQGGSAVEEECVIAAVQGKKSKLFFKGIVSRDGG
jgi:hypothetical protein